MNKEIKKKQIVILGSTGSIGTQALQVVEEHPELYEVYALTANNKVDLLIAQARKFQPEAVVIANEEKYGRLKEALSDLPIKVYAGAEAVCQIVESGPVDIVLTAMVGYAGLKPTINAIRARKAMSWHSSIVPLFCLWIPNIPQSFSVWPERWEIRLKK